jgi:hypothetical protein
MQQLDFFRAAVRPFPLSRTIEVPWMVRFLTVCRGHYAEKYYRDRCRELAKRMRKSGLSEDEIRRQISGFQDAVQHRLRENHQREISGGAA